MESISLINSNINTVIHPYFKFLRVKAHKYGGLFLYLDIDNEKRTIYDLIKLANNFYNSKIDFYYLVTLPHDDMKRKASIIYKDKGYVLWRDIVGTCIFKELAPDCIRQNALDLVLEFS